MSVSASTLRFGFSWRCKRAKCHTSHDGRTRLCLFIALPFTLALFQGTNDVEQLKPKAAFASNALYNMIRFRLHFHLHLFLNREGRWGTTDDFTASFLHFPLFSTALWDVVNSRLVHSLMLSSHLFLCLPCLLPSFTVPCKMVLARPDERETCPNHFSLYAG